MKLINSISLFFERSRPAEKYRLLYLNGYIYRWSERLLIRGKAEYVTKDCDCFKKQGYYCWECGKKK